MVVALCYGLYYAWNALPIYTAYSAKTMCSCAFISNRDQASVMASDLSSFSMANLNVNYLDSTVIADVKGLASRTAVYREGLGCTLAIGKTPEELKQEQVKIIKPDARQANNYWPTGDNFAGGEFPADLDEDILERALNNLFEEPDFEKLKGTRAVVVVYKGKIIAERYAEGYSKDTPLLGWSMTKSITNAMAGILVQMNLLRLEDDHLFEEWSGEDDPRRFITLDQLLRMSSGLEWDEQYSGLSDATKMLFTSSQPYSLAINKPLESDPDSVWEYSSGTTNLISELIKRKIGGTNKQYWNFPHSFLFNKIGMRSAVIEPGPDGTFIGSSFMYATARDWARIGLLYLNDGEWNGDRILPPGWVEYTQTATPKAPRERYGAHFWRTRGEREALPDIPKDAFHMSGYEGQKVVIIPSYDLVLVRLGFSQPESNWDFPGFVKDIVSAFPYR
ncbi:MAG: serine hydrolase [Cyclobacteriaceae bacterium]|nr:MAG: serine hydrolase [Cyclobacteriaceae bacterium]